MRQLMTVKLYLRIYLSPLLIRFYILKNRLTQDMDVFTHLTVEEKLLIHQIVKKNKPQICVEIGSFLGASSCFICSAIPASSKLYCIDTWGNHAMSYWEEDTEVERDTYLEFKQNTLKYKDKIFEIRKWSTEAINTLKEHESNIDFLFIDGDHNYESVKKEWDLYSPLLSFGSIVAFHDTGWAEGVNRVISESVISRACKIAELPNIQFFKVEK